MPSADPGTGVAAPATQRRRDPWIDNAKAVLVLLVVVGHFLTLAPPSAPAAHVYDFVYLFHIPAFVLVSGWTSRRVTWSRRHLGQLFTMFLAPYLLLSPLMAWVRVDLSDEVRDYEALQPWWIDPSWPFWYLLAMVVWRLATPVLRSHWLWVPASVLLSLVVGQWDLPWLDLNRVFGFLPFFVLGLHLPARAEGALRHRASVAPALAVMAGLWWFAAHTDAWFPTEWLYFRSPYDHLDVSVGEGMATRAALLALGLAGALAALALVPRRRHAFTAIGAWTMVVYLLHGFVKQFAVAADVVAWLPEQPWAQVLWIVAGSLAVGVLLGWPPVARRLEWLVDPVGTVRSLAARVRTLRNARAADPMTPATPNGESCPSAPPPSASGRDLRGAPDTTERARRAPDGGGRRSAGPPPSR